jgi:imidazolonepropionase
MNRNQGLEKGDSLWTGCRLFMAEGDRGIVEDGAIAVKDGSIWWAGPASDLPKERVAPGGKVFRVGGKMVTPGLIDCHTHLIWAGSRAREFEMRLRGASYEEIARAGGGILNTVEAVRLATEDELYRQSARRVQSLLEEGVTTVEIKSGYGLATGAELKMLRVAKRLGNDFPVTVIPTFLGAHALPPEYTGRPDAYIDLVVEEMLPAVAAEGLAAAVDAFCERIAFSPAQVERVFSAARDLGFRVKLHAEQLSDQKGALMAARFDALSADHLEYLLRDGAEAMAEKDTVAVLLPGAFYFLREMKKPPVHLLRELGVPMALSTDCNPGSSPCTSPLLVMNMACVLFGLTPREALLGMTVHGARALGIQDRVGRLAAGKAADFVVWDVEEPVDLVYPMGGNPCSMVVRGGRVVVDRRNGVRSGRLQ